MYMDFVYGKKLTFRFVLPLGIDCTSITVKLWEEYWVMHRTGIKDIALTLVYK